MNSQSSLGIFFSNLRKKKIIEILAAFIAGGWLFIEFVHFVLIGHYHFPEKTLDLALITLICILLCTLIWRWFSAREHTRKFKLEIVLIPLVVLVTVLLDLNLLLHLKAPESETVVAPIWNNSIAVLPFVDMSPQKDQESFCDGITVDLIDRLSNIRELKVPARTSAFMFKGKTPDMHEVGEKLKVQTALEGTVQKSGSSLRITAQLSNIADGYNLWSAKYDRELKDVFAIQDEISSAIVDTLRLKLTTQERKRIVEHPIDNIAAYEWYLRARPEIFRFTKESVDLALQYLQNGLNLIGENAALYAGLAAVYWQYFNIGVMQEDGVAKANEYAQKALALDPNLALAHFIIGELSGYKNYPENWHEMIHHCKLALAANPYSPEALDRLSYDYCVAGKFSMALPLIEKFMKVDPLNPRTFFCLGSYYLFGGKYGLAAEQFQKQCQADPQDPAAQICYALTLSYNKEIDKALDIIDQCAKINPDNVLTKFGLLLKFGLLKDKEKALKILTPDFQQTCKRDFVWSYNVAIGLSLADAKKEALDWLEHAVNRGFINYPLLAEKDLFLANIRGEPRFKKLMERVKYEWEHFEE